jgi:pimeloyl-ACP methyl ester carboxylesterase
MKRLVTVLLLVLTLNNYAQVPDDWGSFCRREDIAAYQGCRFKISAAIRAADLGSGAGAEIWVRIRKSDSTWGFFYLMLDKPVKSPQWQTYSIEGRIDKKGQYMLLGGLYERRGNFYFDDFQLQVETKKGNWQTIPLPDAGFEQASQPLSSPWQLQQSRPFFALSLDHDHPFEGKNCIHIDGTRFTNAFGYGHNDTAGKYVQVNGIQLYYEVYGQGSPLLLLHGNSESISSFSKQIPAFSAGHRVIAVDTRGHGNSLEDGRRYTYELFAEDMDQLLDQLQLDSVDVVGWSDGGITGLILSMQHSRRVRRLAVMGANIFMDHSVVDNWVIKSLDKEKGQLAKDTSYIARNRIRLIDLVLSEPKLQFADLKAIHCPVLVMAGQKDLIKEWHTRQIASAIVDSRLLIFPGGTHQQPTDAPEIFNRAVLQFIDQ